MTPQTGRRATLIGLGAALAATAIRPARAQDVVRIALPTKTYFPTVITEAAVRQKLFAKEGIGAEPTVYRGGAECLEAMAAGAADITVAGAPTVGVVVKKGVGMKIVATAARGYMGWSLLVRPDSPVTKVEQLANKKVGITSAGSGSDFLALWTNEQYKTPFTPGLSHMTFSELREETSEELIIPAGLFELSLDRSFGAFQPGEVERQSA